VTIDFIAVPFQVVISYVRSIGVTTAARGEAASGGERLEQSGGGKGERAEMDETEVARTPISLSGRWVERLRNEVAVGLE
jgi:hypothetical protein